MEKEDFTDFGFKKVKSSRKSQLVANVFNSVADKYDIMNDAMSLGIHRVWKRFALDCSGVLSGHKVLDLAAGSGDLSAKFAPIVGPLGHVVVSDINHAMLSVGQDKLTNLGHVNNLTYVQADAQNLPFNDNSFDLVCISFGIRNVTDKQKALNEMHRVLKPGGRAIILEFTTPENKFLANLYDFYSFNLIPKIGKFIADDEDSYRYLAESIRMHPKPCEFKDMMKKAKFENIEYFMLTGGIVVLHRGFKI